MIDIFTGDADRKMIACVINEIARVDTPSDLPILEFYYVQRDLRIRRKPLHTPCGSCHRYSGAQLCGKCVRLSKVPVPESWVRALALRRVPDPRNRGVSATVAAHVVIARFLSYTKRTSTGCLEWQAKRDDDGYGTFWAFSKETRAHRFVYELEHGPTDKLVCHTCDNPPCVEGAHLFGGTVADNSTDMRSKGRSARGERSGLAKLTETQVREIRIAVETETYKSVAARYGVVKNCIGAVATRKTWKHLL